MGVNRIGIGRGARVVNSDDRRVVRLQVAGGVFAEAWRGRPVRLADKLFARPGDVLVLGEEISAAPAGPGRVSGREVQGRCEVDRASAGGRARYLVPVLRWDLRKSSVLYDVSNTYPRCMTESGPGSEPPR